VRIAVLSDIHSNLVALDAVLAAIGSVDAVWHLGDVVGYGPEPDAVVERLTTIGAVGVRGNHDAAAAGGSEIDWFNPDARAAMEWTRDAISPTTHAWLAALPVRRMELAFTLVHGSPRDPIWEYVTSAALARAGLSAISTEHGLHGHTHIPVVFTELDIRWNGVGVSGEHYIRVASPGVDVWSIHHIVLQHDTQSNRGQVVSQEKGNCFLIAAD
jgi:predicted phosphodiesterase